MTDENDRPTWTPPPEPEPTPELTPETAAPDLPTPEAAAQAGPGPQAAPPSEPTPGSVTPPPEAMAPPQLTSDAVAADAREEAPAVEAIPSVAAAEPDQMAAEPAVPAAPAGGEASTVEPLAAPAVPVAGPPVDVSADHPAPPATDDRRGRRRWALAIGVVAIIAIGIGIVAVLAGRGGLEAIAPRYLPATTVVYGDVRFDLPGDQRQEVTALLALFPGFEDASTLELKADDTFERLVKEATQGDVSYTGDIKPWFGGQVAVGVTGLPDIGSLIDGGASDLQLPILGLISVKDATAAEATLGRFATAAQAAGMSVTSSDVEGHPTWTISDGSATDAGSQSATVTLTSDMLVVGMDAADVAASVSLGTEGGANLAGSNTFTEAIGELPEARLATLYLDGAGLRLAAGALATVPGLGTALQDIPVTVAGAMTVTDGDITMTARTTHPESAEPIVDTPSTLASEVPGASLAFVEVHGVGTAISALLAQAKTQPGIEALGVPVETIEGLLGAKLEDLFAWVGDVAVVGWIDDGQPAGAVVSQVTDAAAADERIRQVQAFLQLAGIGGAVTTSTSTYEGATITSVTVSDSGTDVTISFTLSEGTFVLGLGEASVKAVLDVTPETALSADAGYQATMSAAGPSTNSGSAYVDLRGAREAIEPMIPADQRARYDQELKPWLLPFDQMGAVTYQDGSTTVSQTVITTQQP